MNKILVEAQGARMTSCHVECDDECDDDDDEGKIRATSASAREDYE
jgi:hypothetical protein